MRTMRLELRQTFLRGLFVAITTLMLAAGCSNPGVDPANLNYTGDPVQDFVTALHAGDTATVQRLIEGDPSLLELQDDVGQTPMHYAALGGKAAIIRLLHEKGMDTNVRDAEGRTPLTVLEDSGFRFEGAREALLDLGGTN